MIKLGRLKKVSKKDDLVEVVGIDSEVTWNLDEYFIVILRDYLKKFKAETQCVGNYVYRKYKPDDMTYAEALDKLDTEEMAKKWDEVLQGLIDKFDYFATWRNRFYNENDDYAFEKAYGQLKEALDLFYEVLPDLTW